MSWQRRTGFCISISVPLLRFQTYDDAFQIITVIGVSVIAGLRELLAGISQRNIIPHPRPRGCWFKDWSPYLRVHADEFILIIAENLCTGLVVDFLVAKKVHFQTLFKCWKLQIVVSPNELFTGDAGYRSPYFSHAKRALYHLSYIPIRTSAPLEPGSSGNWTRGLSHPKRESYH
jgi:hypothetical protein